MRRIFEEERSVAGAPLRESGWSVRATAKARFSYTHSILLVDMRMFDSHGGGFYFEKRLLSTVEIESDAIRAALASFDEWCDEHKEDADKFIRAKRSP